MEEEGWLELGSSIDFEILLGLMKLRVVVLIQMFDLPVFFSPWGGEYLYYIFAVLEVDWKSNHIRPSSHETYHIPPRNIDMPCAFGQVQISLVNKK